MALITSELSEGWFFLAGLLDLRGGFFFKAAGCGERRGGVNRLGWSLHV